MRKLLLLPFIGILLSTSLNARLVGNQQDDTANRVWTSCSKDTLTIRPDRKIGPITPYLYGTGMEDVNHEIYGGLYDQMLFGESFEEGVPLSVDIKNFRMFDARWHRQGQEVYVQGAKTAKLIYSEQDKIASADVDVMYNELQCDGNAAGLLLSVSDCHDGADAFCGYEISLHGKGRYIIVGRHDNNFQLLGHLPVNYEATQWHRLHAEVNEGTISVSLDGKPVGTCTDTNPLPMGRAGLRTYEASASFRNLTLVGGTTNSITFAAPDGENEVSSMWIPLGDGKFCLTQDARHGNQAQCICNEGNGRLGIRNMGLNRWGIAVQKGHQLDGHVFLKTLPQKENKKDTRIYVALLNSDGTIEYARHELPRISKKWKRYDFSLTPDADDTDASFAIYLEGPGSLAVDQAELMHTASDRFRGQPIRKDLAERFHEQGVTFMRYGGSMVNAPGYTYANMRGKRAERAPYRGHWYRQSTNGFGIKEFVDFAEAEGCELSFAINIEEQPKVAAQMVRDLRGRVKYIEIGNEEVLIAGDRDDLYEHYVERFLLLREAMLKEDPTLQFICSAWWRPDLPVVERTFRALDGKADFWDYHPWVDDYRSAMKVEGELRCMQRLFHKWNPETQMRCAILEENGNSHGIRRALCHAIVQNAVRRMGDFVLTTCPANALEPYHQNDNGWNQGQIFFTPSQSWGMPPFYVQQMSAQHHQPYLVESNLSSPNPMLDITATSNEDGSIVVLHIVNISSSAENLCLAGCKDRTTITTLFGEENGANTPQQPDRISPHTYQYDASAPILLHPHSYTVVEIKN